MWAGKGTKAFPCGPQLSGRDSQSAQLAAKELPVVQTSLLFIVPDSMHYTVH